MILFCLPYAGGSKVAYFNWKKLLDKSIKLYPIELKGRGERYGEGYYKNVNEAVEDIYSLIEDKIEKEDYAIWGHSMGSILAYELYHKIDKLNARKPKHIFFSGHEAPNVKTKKEISALLPDYEFMKKVIELGGTPEELINNRELLELYVPILKNDFRILENYNYENRGNKIQCDTSILNGKQDSIDIKDIFAWENHVSKGIKIYNLDGNHFFINQKVKNVIDIINNTLVKSSNNLITMEFIIYEKE